MNICEHVFGEQMYTYLVGVEWLGHMICMCSVLIMLPDGFLTVAQIYTLSSREWRFHLFQYLTNTRYIQSILVVYVESHGGFNFYVPDEQWN